MPRGYKHSYVIPYSFDSNFDDVAVDEALRKYLRKKHHIRYEIQLPSNTEPLIYTTHPLTREMRKEMNRLIEEAGRGDSI